MKINVAFHRNRRIIWAVGYLFIAILIGLLHEDAYQEEQHERISKTQRSEKAFPSIQTQKVRT